MVLIISWAFVGCPLLCQDYSKYLQHTTSGPTYEWKFPKAKSEMKTLIENTGEDLLKKLDDVATL
jgi:hypothetical protein